MIDGKKIWSSAQLPSLPAAALRLVELSKNPESDVREFVRVIQSDPAIAARILKAANSSYFGLANRVQSVDRALMLLGTKSVIALALGFSLVDASASPGPIADAYRRFWQRSAVQAAAAEALDEQLALGTAGDTLLTGLLIDLGQLAFLRAIPDDYLKVLAMCESLSQPLVVTERELLGLDHIEVGLELVRRWKLPNSLERALALHHESPAAMTAEASKTPTELNICRVAATAAAVGDYFCEPSKGLSLERLRTLTETFWAFSSSRIDAFLNGLREPIEGIAAMMSIPLDALESPAELLSQANEQLALLAMSAQAENTQARARQEVIENEIRDLEVRHTQLRERALRDTLTGVYNRQFFEETMAREFDRCARQGLPLGIVFFDVDRFKLLNDTMGHTCGDEALRRVARVVDEAVRGSDVLARYGGEEFVILATNPTEKGITRLAERVRAAVEVAAFDYEGQRVAVTISVGTALAVPGRNDETAGLALVQAADAAMYAAKQAGRNRVMSRVLLSDFDRDLVQRVNARRFSRWVVRKGTLEIASVSRALLQVRQEPAALGDLALETGLLNESQVQRTSEARERTGERFGEAALALGFLNIDQLATLLALQQESPRRVAAALAALKVVGSEEVESLVHAYQVEHGLVEYLQPA